MSRRLIYDIIFIVLAAVVFVCAVFIPPVRSIADQGDFERVMHPCGLDFFQNHSYYDFAERFFDINFDNINKAAYIPRLLLIIPSTSFIIPTALTNLLCMAAGVFDMRVLAVIMFLWYTAVCVLILHKIQLKSPVLNIIFIMCFIFVFFNGVNLTIFNSLYGQSIMLASFATVVLAGIYLFEWHKISYFIFFTVSSCMLLGAKLQCFIFTPFLIILLLYSGFKHKKITVAVICSVFVLWHGIGGYIINGGNLNTDTQYNSVFYGILKNSPTPEEDLKSLGIDTDMAADAGKHAYLPSESYKYPPRTDTTTEKFNDNISNFKLIKFYITHPMRLISAMETTAQNAFYNKIDLGTFEEKYGFESGKSSYRLTMWENLRSGLPKTLFFIIPVWCLFLTVSIFILRRSKFCGLALLSVFTAGAMQFAMPYIGNGETDISKQLFMFNIIFDFGIILCTYLLLTKLDKKLNKSERLLKKRHEQR